MASRSRRAWLAGLAVLGLARPAFAAPVAWDFEGALVFADTLPADLGLAAGYPLSGSVVLDPAGAELVECSSRGSACTYRLPASMRVVTHGHVLEGSTQALLEISSLANLFSVSFGNLTESRPHYGEIAYDGAAIAQGFILLSLWTLPPIAPDGLPAPFLPAPEVDGNSDWLQVSFGYEPNPVTGFRTTIRASIWALEVPEPPAAALVGSGLFFLALRRAGRADG